MNPHFQPGDKVVIARAFPPSHWNGIRGTVISERHQPSAGDIVQVFCDDGKTRTLFTESLDHAE